jgi:hypothetical protein
VNYAAVKAMMGFVMPFRNMDTLESWLEDFRSLGYPDSVVRVMPQDGEDGSNTGLVGVHLENAATVVYIQPESAASTRWVVTFESREDEEEMDAASLLKLASELSVVSALCAFLEAKSAAYAVDDQA